MSFWSSDRDPVAAANVLWDIGRALSELEGEGELVKEQTSFLEKLTKTLEAVNKAMKEDHVPQGLQDDITAIWKPLLETEVEIVSSMGLNEDEVKTENMESVTSRFYMKIVYYERFSSKITRLQTEVVIPLSNLHRSITTMLPQNLPRSWQTFKRWAVESKRHSDKRLVDQTKEWLEPASFVEEKYQAYTDNISSSDYEWFFSKQEYIDWYNQLSKKSSPILWISGIPGVGRTQIAARVVQKLREDRRTAAYLFYGNETLTQLDIRRTIATLCWELLKQFPEDVELLSEVRNQGGEPTETEVQTVLQRICERRDVIIVLDGLDECGKQGERQWFCQFLSSLNDVCDVIIFSQELEDIKWDLSNYKSIPRVSNCEADFWNEIEKVPTRCAAGSESSEMKEKRVMDAEARSSQVSKEYDIHFPRSREDQYRLYAMLRHRICGSGLPAHIARRIIDEAEYWVKSTFERGEPHTPNGVKIKRNAPYLLSDPIDGARHSPVRNVIATCSRNQVWSTYPDQDGSYHRLSEYLDFVVRHPDGSIGALDIKKYSRRPTILYGSVLTFRRLNRSMEVRKMPYSEQTSWIRRITPGSRLGVVPKALSWFNFVEIVRVEIFSTFILEEEHGEHEALRRSKQNEEEILVRIRNIRKQACVLSDSNSGSLIPSYCKDADQLKRITISTTLKDSSEQSPSHEPNCKDKNSPGSISTAVVDMIWKLLRPGVRPGYKRLEWTCVSHFLQSPRTYMHLHDRLAENLSTAISKKRNLDLLINLPPD